MYYVLKTKKQTRVYNDFGRANAQYKLWVKSNIDVVVDTTDKVPSDLVFQRPIKAK